MSFGSKPQTTIIDPYENMPEWVETYYQNQIARANISDDRTDMLRYMYTGIDNPATREERASSTPAANTEGPVPQLTPGVLAGTGQISQEEAMAQIFGFGVPVGQRPGFGAGDGMSVSSGRSAAGASGTTSMDTPLSYAPGGVNTANPGSFFNETVAGFSGSQGAPAADDRPQARPF